MIKNLNNETNNIPTTDDRSIKLMFRMFHEYVLQYRFYVLASIICMIICSTMTTISAWLLDPIVNQIFIKKNNSMLLLIGGSVLAVFTLKSIASYFQEVLLTIVGQRIISDIQNQLFNHIIYQDVDLFQICNSGTLVSRFTYDINAMRTAVSSAFIGIGRDVFLIIFMVGLIFYQDWLLAIVVLIVSIFSIYPLHRLSKKMRKIATKTQEKMGCLTTSLLQTFHGIKVIKSYGLEEFERTIINRLVMSICDLSIRAVRVEALVQPIIDLLGGIAITSIIIYGGTCVINGVTTPGTFFSFIASVLMVYQPMRSLSKINISLQTGISAAYRIFSLLDHQSNIKESINAITLQRIPSTVCFKTVSFSYDGINNALNEVTFEAPAGSITALVGPSGSGKSTVFNLIQRFYDPNHGCVTINGLDIRDVTFISLRDAIATISQEIVLFDDNVINNIRCGRLDANDIDVFSATRSADAEEFIERMSDGYLTQIGEHGLRLSGGQRQRITIARAILKEAPILLLDEATSALDLESEHDIQIALDSLMKDKTTIVIAHRLSTIKNANIIHVFDHGKIVESGNHYQLLKKCGLYAHLYELQFTSSNIKTL
ncbi:MAG: ATP-binding cassette domain-containing protein [Rhodospirillaceae bacterium]|nr:ATP-binding cassette domain-containing protein [Rhodospirillaceae bacterium]